MIEKNMIPLSITIEGGFLTRLNAAYQKCPFKSRLEFIRYLLDHALTTWERQNDAP